MIKFSLAREGSLNEFDGGEASLESFKQLICQKLWSPSLFKESRRSIANFSSSHLLVYDVDEGISVSEMTGKLQELRSTEGLPYKFIIGSSKSHQREKNGKVEDRFRIIFFLDEPSVAAGHYKKLMIFFAKEIGIYDYVDPACLDAARMYYPCREILEEGEGDSIRMVETTARMAMQEHEGALRNLSDKPAAGSALMDTTEKGELSKATYKFLLEGAVPGTRHKKLVKACLDMKQNNYSYEEALELLEGGKMPLDDHAYKQIEDVYENREVRYPAREPFDADETREAKPTALIVSPSSLVDEMYEYLEDQDKVAGISTGIAGLDKLLGGGFREGQLEVIMAQAKVGKSTLFHQIQYNILMRGEKLGYMSRELNPATEVLPNYLSIANQTNVWLQEPTEAIKAYNKELLQKWDDKLYFMKGYGHVELQDIREWMLTLKEEFGVKIVFADHMHWMLEDSEDFKLAAKLVKDLKHLTKELDMCMVLIIQPTKIHPDQKLGLNTLRGGAAIGQALDTLLTLERYKCDTPNISKLTLTDARHKLAKPGTIYLEYDPKTTQISEVELVPAEEEEPKRIWTSYQ